MRTILPVVLLCHFLAAFTVLGVPLYLPKLLAPLGVASTSSWSGVLFSLPAIMTAVFAGYWGGFADRYGRRLSLQRALASLTLAFVLAGLAPSLVWLVLALALQGMAGGTLVAANGYLSQHFDHDLLAKALNWTQFSARLALLVAPPLMGGILMLLPNIGQKLWLVLALLPLTAFFISFSLPTESKTAKGGKTERVKVTPPLSGALWCITFFFNFAMVVTFPYFLPYASNWLHQDLIIGLFYSWPHLIYLLLLPLLHLIPSRQGYFVLGMLLIAFASLLQGQIVNFFILAIARTLFGVGILLAYSGINQLLSTHIQASRAGAQFGKIDAAGKWGGVAAGVSAGWLVSHVSLQAPFWASAFAAVIAMVSFVNFVVRGINNVGISRSS